MNYKRFFVFLSVISALNVLSTQAAETATFDIKKNGSVVIGDLPMEVVYFNPEWRSRELNAKSLRDAHFKSDDNQKEVSGVFNLLDGHKFNFTQKLTKVGDNSWKYLGQISSDSPVPTNELALSINLKCKDYAGQEIFINGKSIVLPEKVVMKNGGHISSGNGTSITVPTVSQQVTISGNYTFRVQDNRKYLGDDYAIRIRFTKSHGNVKSSDLSINLSRRENQIDTIDIAPYANMSFTDEVENDKKGGWTDQGPTNDLRSMATGVVSLKEVKFNIIDPAKNNDKSCMVFAGPQRDYMLQSAVVDAGGKKGKCLYLAHATAWTAAKGKSVGEIKVTAEDGSVFKKDIISQQDIADWWGPVDMPNAKVAWRSDSERSRVGIYVSRFTIPEKKISTIEFTPTKRSVWGIVGISVGDYIPFSSPKRDLKMKANKEWHKFKHEETPEKSSILDFSFMNDAPAGKYGRLIIKDNKFVFENRQDQPVRFWGANLCFQSNYLDKKDAEIFADRLAAQGYNSIRLHHFDGMLTKGAKNGEFDARRLDQIEYLFHCLKQRGIYMTIDLYISRNVTEEIPGLGFECGHLLKALYPINQGVRDNWKAFARKFMNRVNPYTGLSWKDDPALISLCPINENYLFVIWKQNPKVKKLYIEKYKEWCKEKNVKPGNPHQGNPVFSTFLNELQMFTTKDTFSFLKNELKVKTLLTDVNHGEDPCQTPVRSELDYVDNHSYWDHPQFPEQRWKLPIKFSNNNIITSLGFVPRKIMPTRFFNKPFCVTEFNFSFPNHSRGTGSMMMGAYASLQDWDGMYAFDARYTTKIRSMVFDIMADPISYLGNRMICLLYRRTDIKPAKNSYVYMFTDKDSPTRDGFADSFSKLGLVSKIGTVDARFKDYTLPENCVAGFGMGKPDGFEQPFFKADNTLSNALNNDNPVSKGSFDLKNSSFTSDTGELTLNGPEGLFKVVTPKTEGIALNGTGEAKGLRVKANITSQKPALIFVSSMDNEDIGKSKKLLLFHLTDSTNTNLEYQSADSSIVAHWGEMPLLLQRGSAKVSINFDDSLKTQVWAISPSGKRIMQLKSAYKDGVLMFDVATDISPEGVIAYEIVRETP